MRSTNYGYAESASGRPQTASPESSQNEATFDLHQPGIPVFLPNAVGLAASHKAQADAHMLAALAPQMANFGGGQRNDLATRALITSLLAEPMDEEEPETQEEKPEVDALTLMKAAHLPDNARLVIEEMCDKMAAELKKGAVGLRSSGVGHATAPIDQGADDSVRNGAVASVIRLARRRGTYAGKTALGEPEG